MFRRFCVQYAYIRVSSADQNIARQEEALSKAGFQPDKIYVEHASAKDTNRPELQKLLEQLRPGDTLLVHSIDRLCRNMMDMCAVTTRLRHQGVTLIFLKEQLTFSTGTSNPMQELQLHMMSAFSQFERALLKERQCRYGEVIFTGIFSQLALPTSIHRFTGDNRCQNPDGPLTRKST
ncbi:recombinase family protein, partial [Salmonella enterica]|uniref:recombinase family protein n=1 Tax=Salmonella enterica TaxID=28901 RepID=UPI0022873A8D